MNSFEAIVAPMEAPRFLDEVLGNAPLHLEGGADKWQSVMSWPVLNRLLGMTSIWSTTSLALFLDKEPIPAVSYAAPAVGRDGVQVLRPDPAKVRNLLARGATLVLNDIDQLTPELSAFCSALEVALGGKVQANLYLSSKRRQGFRVHFDTHDVFAAHCMGEKTWMVYEGRADAPIAHPMFKSLPQEHHEKAKGALWKEVRLRPGDLLYLPRGQYHYALADDGACCHIAFGVTYPIGLDAITYLFERMVAEPLARANLPADPSRLETRLVDLGARVAAVLGDDKTRADTAALMAGFRYPRAIYTLPDEIESARERFAVRDQEFKLVESGGRCGLARTGSREAVEVPPSIRDLVAWVLSRRQFERPELATAFPGKTPATLDKFLADMERMRVLERAI